MQRLRNAGYIVFHYLQYSELLVSSSSFFPLLLPPLFTSLSFVLSVQFSLTLDPVVSRWPHVKSSAIWCVCKPPLCPKSNLDFQPSFASVSVRAGHSGQRGLHTVLTCAGQLTFLPPGDCSRKSIQAYKSPQMYAEFSLLRGQFAISSRSSIPDFIPLLLPRNRCDLCSHTVSVRVIDDSVCAGRGVKLTAAFSLGQCWVLVHQERAVSLPCLSLKLGLHLFLLLLMSFWSCLAKNISGT